MKLESEDRFPKLWVYTATPAKGGNKKYKIELQHALTVAIREIKNGYIYQGLVSERWEDRIVPLSQRPRWSTLVDSVGCRGRNPDLVIVANIRKTFRGIDDLHTALSQRLFDIAWHRPTVDMAAIVDTRHPCWKHQSVQIQSVLKMARNFEPFKFHPAMGINLPWVRPIFQAMDVAGMTDQQIAHYMNSKGITCPDRWGETRPRWTPKDVEYWRESFRQWRYSWAEKEKNHGRTIKPRGSSVARPGPPSDGAAGTGNSPGGRDQADQSHQDGSGI